MKQQHNQLYKSIFGIGAVVLCCVLLFPVLRSVPAGAQTQPAAGTTGEPELDTRITTFFRTLQTGTSALAFATLLHDSPLGSDSTLVAALVNNVDNMRNEFGEIFGSERLEPKRIGTDVIVLRYILKYDEYPVIWSFAFYRKPSRTATVTPTHTWVLVELQFDTKLLNL